MSHMKVTFDGLPWDEVAPGLRVKKQAHGGKLLRLVEFTADYDDQVWCEAGHSGFVLDGELTLIYDDGPVSYVPGDGLQIEDGAANRHRTSIAPGTRALIFLVEDHTS